ncbi:MAG TPA: hypothetical protein VLE43_09235 [Candidatus Saccharimonadia bacterium]|nr:hypothetical protein [Candidatus Saccharimonadia bacterium]
MAHKSKLLLSIAVSVAVAAILAAFAAWVVCRYHPRPYFSAFWPCFGGALFVGFALEGLNIIEFFVFGGMMLLVATVSIPILAHSTAPALPAFTIASVASGMLSSRVFRRGHSRQW